MRNRLMTTGVGWFAVITALVQPVMAEESKAALAADPGSAAAALQPLQPGEVPLQPSGAASGGEADVALLIHKLTDPDSDVRAAGAVGLKALGPKAKAAVPNLIAMLEDDGISSAGEPVWILAAQALGKMGPDAVADLIAALRHSDPHVIKGAAAALGEIGPASKQAVGLLMAELEKDHPETRITLMYALMRIGPDASQAVPLLVKMLDHEDFHAQYWACQALGGIGPPAEPATPVLCRLVSEGPASVRRHAAAALGGIGPGIGPEGLGALTKALRDPVEPVRENAVIALGRLGDFAKPAIAEIRAVLAEDKLKARTQAARTMWHLTRDADLVVPVLIDDLTNELGPSPEAAVFLGEMGEAAQAAVPQLVESLQSRDLLMRLEAAKALGRIGPAAEPAVPALAKALEDESADVRRAAQKSLQEIKGK